jgi:hypothetical protein
MPTAADVKLVNAALATRNVDIVLVLDGKKCSWSGASRARSSRAPTRRDGSGWCTGSGGRG